MFATNVGERVLPVTASADGLYFSATVESRTGKIHLKIVNPAGQAVATQLTSTGRRSPNAQVEVLAGADPTAGDTLAEPDAIVPGRTTLRGHGGAFAYQAPANSVTVVTLGG